MPAIHAHHNHHNHNPVNGTSSVFSKTSTKSNAQGFMDDEEESGGPVRLISDDHRMSKLTPANETVMTANSGFPVSMMQTERPHEEGIDRQNHFKDDILDIGSRLNEFNNDLYHVLIELLNRQPPDIKTTLHNLKARDYNAALTGRDWHIKPLKDQSGKLISNLFLNKDKDKGIALRVAQLNTELSNEAKQSILNDLGMKDDFNSFLENIRLTMEEEKSLNKKFPKSDANTIKVKGASPSLHKAVSSLELGASDIMAYLAAQTLDDLAAWEKSYSDYLLMQLRVAIGLSRTFCHCPAGV
ncbi:hypothetical protein E8E14_012967 [Neopestalotiopsis sp. 37M]|nr:hypothetical protein E8E14_012967 [Neopestalotiopsis sp. 37M]